MNDSQKLNPASNEEAFFDKFADALITVRAINPALGKMVARLGSPLIDETIPTAQVRLDLENKAIEFAINPEFYLALDNETAAAVITHEAYHVLLNHLSEVGDRKNYPDTESLVVAHECLANDSLMSSTGLEPKQNPYRGLELFNTDFSYLTTPEAYAIVSESNENNEETPEDSSDETQESSNDDDEGSDSGSDENQENSSDDSNDSDSSSDGDSESNNADGSDSSDGEAESSDSTGEGSSEGDSENFGDSENSSESNTGSFCGGVKIVSSTGEADQSAVSDALSSIFSDLMDDVNVDDLPQQAQNALESLADEGIIEPPRYDDSIQKDGYSRINEVASMNVNWVELLAKINPKIKSSGKPKRVKDSWHAPNRRLMSVYPQVILPTRKRPDSESGKKGDAVPSFVIALDMSPSIPTELLGDLAAFAQSIPEKLIKAYPITWSSTYRVFDPENPHVIVRSEFTYVSAVKDYVDVIAKETGTRPYVLVITDGGFSDAWSIPQDEALSHWWFMGIEPGHETSINNNVGSRTNPNRIFRLRDFTS